MFKLLQYLFIFILLHISLEAYESEDKLKTAIVGKVAKYILWRESQADTFVITILNNKYGTLFDEVYFDKNIKSKPVVIRYIDNIENLESTDILYIAELKEFSLDKILQISKNRNILTVSDMRGFAQKGGDLQLYFVGQKLKLKMNIDAMQEEGFHIERTLLKIVEVDKIIEVAKKLLSPSTNE